jgi:serine/threonine protein kinase
MHHSPERLQGGSYKAVADIWSLGLTLLASSIGSFPYAFDKAAGYWGVVSAISDSEPPQLPADMGPPELRDFIKCCLVRDPAQRWTAAQLLEHPLIVRHASLGGSAAQSDSTGSFLHDAARQQQDLADIRILVEKANAVEYGSARERADAVRNMVASAAQQFGLEGSVECAYFWHCDVSSV